MLYLIFSISVRIPVIEKSSLDLDLMLIYILHLYNISYWLSIEKINWSLYCHEVPDP